MLDKNIVISTLLSKRWVIRICEWTDTIEAKHIAMGAMLQFVPPNDRNFHGRVNIASIAEFCKWGNSEDYICYRWPRNERQLMNLLSSIGPLMQYNKRHPSQGDRVDVTYLLRKPRYYKTTSQA